MKIRFSQRAADDLISIKTWIARNNPAGADAVEAAILRKIDRLRDFPQSARQTDIPGLRALSIVRFPYIVFYEVGLEAVEILHVRHAARDSNLDQ